MLRPIGPKHGTLREVDTIGTDSLWRERMKFTPSVAASNARLAYMLGAMALSSALVGGCGSNKPTWMSLDPDDWSNRRIADQPLLLELAGPISIDVGTFAGDVV